MSDHAGAELVDEAQQQVSLITCDEYKAILDRGDKHVLLDVREPSEWEEGHMEGAIHIPRGVLEMKAEEAMPDRDIPIIVYCRSGARSALSGETLQEMGYTNVQNLKNGIIGWNKKYGA